MKVIVAINIITCWKLLQERKQPENARVKDEEKQEFDGALERAIFSIMRKIEVKMEGLKEIWKTSKIRIKVVVGRITVVQFNQKVEKEEKVLHTSLSNTLLAVLKKSVS